MAKLSAHGAEIGRIRYTSYEVAYMSDGKILRKIAGAWKLYKKCKPGVDPAQAYRHASEKQVAFLAQRPALAAYRKELHSLAGLGKAWKLHMAIELMPDDPDGVWSEACDGYGDNVHADISEVVELCQLYNLAVIEGKALNASAPVSADA